MTRFTLHFEWPAGARRKTPDARLLMGGDLDDAKVEAAIVYACMDEPPPAYRIVAGARRVAYRYPEPQLRARVQDRSLS